nr:hypothetical protein [Actinomycetota bacterium]
AYDRDVGDIPFARDLIAGDLSGTVRAEAESGTLDVQSVQVDGRGARFSLAGTALTVRLGEPLQPHDRVHLEISLDATLPTWPERYGLWRDKVLLGNWIPTVAVRERSKWRLDPFSEVGDPFYSEIADYDIRIEAADHLGAVGSGVLQSVTPGAPGTRLWRFSALASRDAAVAVAPFMRGLATVARGTVVRSWYSSPQAALGSSNLADAAAAVRDYTRRFGAPAHDEVEVLETEGFLGGMEYPGLIFTSSVSSSLAGVPLLSQLIDHVGFESAQKRYVIGHEVAHQWWYATVGNDQVREPWLDEAFAEMSTRSWLQRVDGSDLAWRVTTGGVSPEPRAGVLTAGVGDFSSNTAYSEVVYAAGAEVLSNLRDRIGAKTFDELLRVWYREERLGIGRVEEFIATAGRVAGPGAERFLRRFD